MKKLLQVCLAISFLVIPAAPALAGGAGCQRMTLEHQHRYWTQTFVEERCMGEVNHTSTIAIGSDRWQMVEALVPPEAPEPGDINEYRLQLCHYDWRGDCRTVVATLTIAYQDGQLVGSGSVTGAKADVPFRTTTEAICPPDSCG